MRKIALVLILILRVVAALVAVWQVIGLLPVLTWFTAIDQVTPGIWVMAIIKVVILLVCILGFFGLKRLAKRLHPRKTEQSETA